MPLPHQKSLRFMGAFATSVAVASSVVLTACGTDPRGERDEPVGAFEQSLLLSVEELVTHDQIIDAEFSQERAEFAWADALGRLWVGKIDRDTGLYDGTAVLVDAKALNLDDIVKITGAGPEWISTNKGDKLVYTRFVGKRHSRATARLAVASPLEDDEWKVKWIERDDIRYAPYGSLNPGDPNPMLTYVDDGGYHYLRALKDSESEVLLPIEPRNALPIAVRQAIGDASLVYASKINDTSQVFRYHIDGARVQQLTFDSGEKDRGSVPWAWRAPEFANQLVVMSIANKRELRIYASAGEEDDDAPWRIIRRVQVPDGLELGSPEPFVFEGKSYVYFIATVPPNDYPTQIWIANIEHNTPMLELLSDDSLLRARIDPELFVSSDGPFLYFNRFDPSMNPGGSAVCDTCYEGVYRVYTGIAPAP